MLKILSLRMTYLVITSMILMVITMSTKIFEIFSNLMAGKGGSLLNILKKTLFLNI